MNSGIYKILNKINGKFYIGSTKNFEQRKYQHFQELIKNSHTNQFLQHSFNKYGIENFEFIILEKVKPNLLLQVEQKYIDLYFDNMNNCFNINPLAIQPPIKKYLLIFMISLVLLYRILNQ